MGYNAEVLGEEAVKQDHIPDAKKKVHKYKTDFKLNN